MISNLGNGLVLASLLFATAGSILGFFAGRSGSDQLWRLTRGTAIGFGVTIVLANLVMVYALVSHDFSVSYVAEVGARSTPLYFTIVSLWASLNGSILFWGGVLGLYVLALVASFRDEHRAYLPWTLHVLMGVSVFFTLLITTIANPFAPMFPVPLDGPGPNPLLQNHWLMAVHPPTLYLGYVGMAVPFSMVCAALLAGRLDAGWMAPLRRWTLIPWTFLTVGIVLGGWWSYGVLGWGGEWAWDPVENASFMPWLAGTAFIHSAMVLERRGVLRDWTLALGMATFLLTLLGTFMTRSGVFNSVHSFTQSDIGPVFLGFIAVVFTYSVVLLAVRSHVLDDAAGPNNELGALGLALEGKGGSPAGALLSREFTILAQNALFTVFTFTVLLGTTYPLIAESILGKRVSVGEPYFDRWALPLGLALAFLMGVGPALPWGRLAPSEAAWRFLPPLGAGVVLAAIFAATGVTKPLVLFTLVVVGFATWANGAETGRPVRARMIARNEGFLTALRQVVRRTRRRLGGHVAHFGILLAVFAIALSRGYRVEKDFTLTKGQTATVGIYSATYTGAYRDNQPHRTSVVAGFDITRKGVPVGKQEPRMNYYPRQREPVWTPAVHSTLTEDFYLSLIEVPPEGEYVVLRTISRPFMIWLWIAAPIIGLGSLIAAFPSVKLPVWLQFFTRVVARA